MFFLLMEILLKCLKKKKDNGNEKENVEIKLEFIDFI